jgi:hypothetical protein
MATNGPKADLLYLVANGSLWPVPPVAKDQTHAESPGGYGQKGQLKELQQDKRKG